MELFFSSSDRLRSPAYQCRRNRSWNTLVYHEPFTAFSRNDKCYSNETDLIDVPSRRMKRTWYALYIVYVLDIPNSWAEFEFESERARGWAGAKLLACRYLESYVLHKWPRALWSGFQVFRFIPVSFAPTFPVTTVNNDLGPSVNWEKPPFFPFPFFFHLNLSRVLVLEYVASCREAKIVRGKFDLWYIEEKFIENKWCLIVRKKKYASKGTRLRAMPFRFWCLSRSERERFFFWIDKSIDEYS